MGSENVTIQTYNEQFKEAFQALNVQWIQKYFRLEDKDRAQLENPLDCLRGGGQIFFTVTAGATPIVTGTCAMYKLETDIYELAKMAVDEAFQGLGHSHRLMEACETWAREQNATKILLYSNRSLDAALALYRKHGYQEFGNGHPDYDRCDIGMEKLLTP